MSPRVPHARLAIAGLAGLAAFGLIFTIGDALGVWPAPPLGGFAGVDIAAGLLFGVALLVVLLRGRA